MEYNAALSNESESKTEPRRCGGASRNPPRFGGGGGGACPLPALGTHGTGVPDPRPEALQPATRAESLIPPHGRGGSILCTVASGNRSWRARLPLVPLVPGVPCPVPRLTA